MDRTNDFEEVLRNCNSNFDQRKKKPTKNRDQIDDKHKHFIKNAIDLFRLILQTNKIISLKQIEFAKIDRFLNRYACKNQDQDVEKIIDDYVGECKSMMEVVKDSFKAFKFARSNETHLQHIEGIMYFLNIKMKKMTDLVNNFQQQPSFRFRRSARLLPDRFKVVIKDEKPDGVNQQSSFNILKKDIFSFKERKEVAEFSTSTPVFDEEETQRFGQENAVLQKHFMEDLDEAKVVETNLAKISELYSQFTDKIVEQQSDIEYIHEKATTSTLDIKRGNDELIKAKDYGQGYGFMIFCIYIIFSLLSLMLHYLHR